MVSMQKREKNYCELGLGLESNVIEFYPFLRYCLVCLKNVR